MTCTSTAGLFNTPTSTNTVEDTIRNIEENISVIREEPITKTDNNGRLIGYFCSDVVFNLSHKVLTDLEISVLGKGLGSLPTPTLINEADLRRDFADFARKIRCKWFFRNEPTEDFSEMPAFRIESNRSPPKGHPALEMFLSPMKREIFSLVPGNSTSYNLTKEQRKTMRGLAEDCSIVIKPGDQGSCVVVWDKLDYLAEAENHLKDNNIYKDAKFGDSDLVKLVEKKMFKCNEMIKQLLSKQNISFLEFKYFSYNYKKLTNLGKMCLLPKIYKRLENVPGRSVISNCDTPTEKVSEFLDYHLKTTMQSAKSYIKDTSNFLKKLNELGKLPENAILVTTDVVRLYPSIPQWAGSIIH